MYLRHGINMSESTINSSNSVQQAVVHSVSILPHEDIDVFQFNGTSVEVSYNIVFMFKIFTT